MSTLLPLLVQQQQGGGQVVSDTTPQARGTYSVMVDWDGDGFDSGTYDELVGMAGYGVKSLRIRRGRDDDLSAMVAGECEIVVHDPDGRFNPQNAASPLAGLILPMRQVRVKGSNDNGATEHDLFTGYVRMVESDQSIGAQETRIICMDGLGTFASFAGEMSDPLGEITTFKAFETLLGVYTPYDGTLDRIATGDLLGDGTAFAWSSPSSAIEELLTLSRGVFYFAADGTAVFEDRYARGARESSATVTDAMTRIIGGTDLDKVYNIIEVTKTGGGWQVAGDAASQALYGRRQYPPIESEYLQDDTQAEALANYLLGQFKDPRPPIWGMELINRDVATMQLILERELQDRITVTESRGGTSDDYHVEGIEHEISDGGHFHRVRWKLSQRAGEAFTVGVSLIGGTDLITY